MLTTAERIGVPERMVGPDPIKARMSARVPGLRDSERSRVPTNGPHDELVVTVARTARPYPPLLGSSRHWACGGLLNPCSNPLLPPFAQLSGSVEQCS